MYITCDGNHSKFPQNPQLNKSIITALASVTLHMYTVRSFILQQVLSIHQGPDLQLVNSLLSSARSVFGNLQPFPHTPN